MTGAELIAAERQRQIDAEGYTPEHDDQHTGGEMALAAMVYIDGTLDDEDSYECIWPWDYRTYKPTGDAVVNLVKAGALIAAEIDRLQRIGG